jgi:O-antigen/teichoic acid export membrane protein
MSGIRQKLARLLETGFFHIVGTSVLNKVVQTLLSLVLVRLLSKEAYGVYAYAYNILSFFVLFNALGMPSALLQICSELADDGRRSDSIFSMGVRVGVAFDAIMGVAVLATGLFAPLAVRGSGAILALYAPLPLAQFLCEAVVTRLRVQLRNKEYAIMTNMQTILLSIASIVGALAGGSAGLAVGQSAGLLFAAAIEWRLYGPALDSGLPALAPTERKDLLTVGAISAFNNGISQALTLVGTFLVGSLMESEELVASYKVATTIPFALVFVPLMLVTYIMPYFTRHRNDRAWTLRRYGQVVLSLVAAMGSICVLLALLADPLVGFLFGADYADCVSAMRILLLGLFLTASFRVPTGNLLVTQRKLSFNSFSASSSIVIDVIASFMLIPTWGMEGAACAYTLTMGYGAIINVWYYLHTVRRLEEHGE